MSRTYNTIGSLTTLKSHLEENNIYDFKSLKEVIDFQSSFSISRQQLISHHKNLIEEEKNLLNAELKNLETEIETQRQQTEQILTDEIDNLKQKLNISISDTPTNLFQKISKNLRHWNYKRKINQKEKEFDSKVKMTISYLVDNYQSKSNRYQFITSNFDEAVKQSAHHSLSELERKKAIIDNLNSFIYGALGEQKVVKALENLSDEYFLINDFSVSFSTAIYNRQENDYIKSVQIDHILVSPSGIFLIETKNWSEKSLESLSLRSPVQQIRRTSFVLFKLLNNEMSNYHLRLDRHHWGDRKISIKNLIVMTNTKPKEEFQYVKILTLNELLGYINYFKPTFSINETQRIADFLLSINEQKVIQTK
ncbi:NERD domain-containing protein [Parapedobacter sp. SGR-10]|uniref:nuclease-related domain-containing protein n=1 Tax=Parapedobacter sp. SGR-10 TaxID=2710879 RepID=UPI0013D05FA6|nr:nuclease-related domain-containing protein [Parapedobacter sp. SGR-10]NGF58319.1 NERD domain-containing protein [Parapedobacter sp. SGR-10]